MDQYNNPTDYSIANAQTREDLKSQFRFNHQFIPIDGEPVDNWKKRVERTVMQLEEYSVDKHIHGKKGAWYTHWSASSCFMCDQATACRFYMIALAGIKTSGYAWKQHEESWIIVKL